MNGKHVSVNVLQNALNQTESEIDDANQTVSYSLPKTKEEDAESYYVRHANTSVEKV
jgi:hypothetical protein